MRAENQTQQEIAIAPSVNVGVRVFFTPNPYQVFITRRHPTHPVFVPILPSWRVAGYVVTKLCRWVLAEQNNTVVGGPSVTLLRVQK